LIPKECKRLAEVDFPIAVVSRHSAREKSGPKGHILTLHLWWARRPLSACRAILLGLLLPDPCDPHCPEDFKHKARELLPNVQGKIGPDDEDLRHALLKFIGDFSNWDFSSNQTYLELGRGLVKAAHEEETPLAVDPFAGGGSIPLEALRLGCEAFASDLNPVACLILRVLLEDIPRQGKKLAEDLRSVGQEIKQKAEEDLAEFYPREPITSPELQTGSFALFKKRDNGFGYVCVGNVNDFLRNTKEEYTHYLPIQKGLELGPNFEYMHLDWKELERRGIKPLNVRWETPIAYLWARTVRCEAPNCGAEIPLVRSFWLCKKTNRKRALRYRIVQSNPSSFSRLGGEDMVGEVRIDFEIFEPGNDSEVPVGTVSRARATCLCCGTVLSPERVRAQLAVQRGGADVIFDEKGNRTDGARMLGVVTLKPGEQGHHYRLPTERDYDAVRKAINELKEVATKPLPSGASRVPDEGLPPVGTLGFRVQRYGVSRWGDLFTARQKLALIKFQSILALKQPGDTKSYIVHCLALALSRVTMCGMSLTNWNAFAEKMQHTFGRQALPMVWDFAEVVSIRHTPGAWENALDLVLDVAAMWPLTSTLGQVQISDARATPLPDDVGTLWFTDPPYYDAVPYADLSDFFFVWLKRTLSGHSLMKDPYDPRNPLTPKLHEIVQDETKQFDGQRKDRAFFEDAMGKAFSEGRRVLKEDGVGCVVFAHKTTEGWEALLSGMIQGGWTITASWPIATEMSSRLRARESAALATSVHLVCRPRPENAPVGDWGEVLRELPNRVGDWMERLQSEGIRGADLVFACIGPALEIFSRYSKVVDAEERDIPLGGDPEATEPHRKGFLAYVWEVVGRTALEQVLGTAEAKARNSTAGALEEDARLTALFLWTLQSANGNGARKEQESDEDMEEDQEDTGKDAGATKKKKGYSLIFDVVRRFAQPLGIHLPEWEGRIIETEKGVVRLLSVRERAKQLFGEENISVAGIRIEEQARRDPQMKFDFAVGAEVEVVPKIKGRRSKSPQPPFTKGGQEGIKRETTTLDRIHAAMLLQSSGQTNALRALLKAEQERGPDFIRLANALSALYPKQSEEKRLLDAMLLAIPR